MPKAKPKSAKREPISGTISTRKQTARKRAPAKPAKTKSALQAKSRKSVASKRGPQKAAAFNDLRFRLSAGLRARAYRLHIDVDPRESDRYTGRLELDATLDSEQSELELHASELTLHSAKVWTRSEQAAEISMHPERETASLRVDKPLPKGKLTIEIEFAGSLRTDLRGLYAASSNDRKYAFTQLQAADARRFFPCLDEPDQKATFQLSVHTGAANTVISNNPIEQTETHADGSVTHHFSATPPLSSYLVALAVGDLICSEETLADEIPIRVVHVPGAQSMTAFALATARECLLRLRAYFGVPYPYAKLDLVAVPDFEIGAMENAGAVFFRETLLLVDEASVSLAEKKRAAEVICHELAHMWYGNLVTMRWWDDLWLNEAFATWMAFDIVAKWRPEWQMWNDFSHARNSALQLDALENTHPIYTPVQTPSEATENFDLITYEKGAAVVRMLERYLGAPVFQKGVSRYIKRHKESNTVAADLWTALSEAAGEDVAKVVRPFLMQPGFPLLRITIARPKQKAQKVRVRLEQELFVATGPSSHSKSKKKTGAAPRWPVPWVGRVGSGKKATFARHLLTKPSETIDLPAGDVRYVYGNADEGGFFRPLHASSDLPGLLDALPELSVSERIGLIQHQWALLEAGYAQLADFLPVISAFANEPEADVLRALNAPVDHLLEDIADSVGESTVAAFSQFIIDTFEPALRKLGWRSDDPAHEPQADRLRRSELVQLVAVHAGSAEDCDQAERMFQRYMADRTQLDPNLIGPVLTLAARRADADRLERMLVASETDATPQARRRFRLSMADVRDTSLAETLLELCLGPRIPTQDVAFVVARMLYNPAVQEHAFSFIQERWSELRERIPAMLMSRLIDATPALRTEQHRRMVQEFFRKNPLPTAARALKQADERFRLDAAFRKRAAPELKRLMAKR
ncbi:MAG TPA: M1 family metallopeptidase [Polyangiales bacterium]|nr:M1 family metallopeptidase [Polyangiales bacterium]